MVSPKNVGNPIAGSTGPTEPTPAADAAGAVAAITPTTRAGTNIAATNLRNTSAFRATRYTNE